MYFFSHPILDMFKQNNHQMKIFEISILLAFFTKNLVKLHLKFVAKRFQAPLTKYERR